MLDIDQLLSELANEAPLSEDPEYGRYMRSGMEEEEEEEEGLAMVRSALTDADVSELTAELSVVQSDDELEEWIGRMFRRVKRRVGRFARSSVGRKMISGLKRVAKKSLPYLGGAAGAWIGGPVGAAVGRKLGRYAGSRLEEEGFDEAVLMEATEQFVRFAAEATAYAAVAPPGLPSDETAHSALARASRRFPVAARQTGSHSGRWIRRGRKVIVVGA